MGDPLVGNLRAGDRQALREAVTLHGPRLYGFLLKLTGRRHLADDLFQETWLALAKHAPRLAEDTRLDAWLITVGRNAYRSHLRLRFVDLSRLFAPLGRCTFDSPT